MIAVGIGSALCGVSSALDIFAADCAVVNIGTAAGGAFPKALRETAGAVGGEDVVTVHVEECEDIHEDEDDFLELLALRSSVCKSNMSEFDLNEVKSQV